LAIYLIIIKDKSHAGSTMVHGAIGAPAWG